MLLIKWPDVGYGVLEGRKEGRDRPPADQVFLILKSLSTTEQQCGLGHGI